MERRAQTILLVDDDPNIRESISETLRRYKHDVSTAGSLAEARRILSTGTRSFELVITDIRLPDGTGLQLAHEIIANLSPPPRIILITGFLDDPQITSLLVNGQAEVLLKPFPLRTLLQHVAGPVRAHAA
ncbi:MAG: response regulator [Alphaproteobacteria bacterium]|nr:response regulator [Alphaproteobacteria bacterium]MCW5741932.1 response regulator [Alphaproteobacteria bacterium]